MTGTESHEGGGAASITVEVPSSEGRVRDAYAAIFSRSFIRVLNWYIWAACVFAFVAFISLVSPKRLFATMNLEFVVVIVLLVFLSFLWLPGWRARLDKTNDLLASVPVVWKFNASRVACRFGEHSSFDAEWRALYAVEKLPHGLLLFAHRVVAHWIPRPAFASDRDFDQVAEWAAFGAPRYRRRPARKLAEWLASLLIAPPAIALILYFAIMIRWGQNLLDSYPTLATVLRFALPSCYAASWFIGAPVYWLMARFTPRLIFFLVAGATLGAIQSLGITQSIGPFQPGFVEWMVAFGVGALLHWLIVVRGTGSESRDAETLAPESRSRLQTVLVVLSRLGLAAFLFLLELVAYRERAWASTVFFAAAFVFVILPRAVWPKWTPVMRAVACAVSLILAMVFLPDSFIR